MRSKVLWQTIEKSKKQRSMAELIETPCVSICAVENGTCIGCGRTVEEVTKWLDYTDNERKIVMERLEKDFNIDDLFD